MIFDVEAFVKKIEEASLHVKDVVDETVREDLDPVENVGRVSHYCFEIGEILADVMEAIVSRVPLEDVQKAIIDEYLTSYVPTEEEKS